MPLLAILFLTACQKQIDADFVNQHYNNATLKSNSGSENSTKKERQVLFVSNRDGNDEVYAMNADGSNLVRLTFNTVPDGRATWSSNEQHIAFASGTSPYRDIVVMNANGNGLRNITNTPGNDEEWPEWAPQGNNVIFSSNRDGNHEIYLYNSDDESTTRLTTRTQDDKWPTFSPDGSKIAFQSNMGAGLGQTDIFVMNADGSGVTRLTNSASFDQMPTWSPDGTKIAFMSARDGNPEIYVMNADGTGQTRLTNLPGLDARPSWSRKDNLIAFTSTRDFPIPFINNYFEIYKMDENGSNPVRLTNNNLIDDYPSIK